MNDISGKVYVTKLAAAERQLREAIWMFFAQRDELTIHTAASAAYRILRDMKDKRGRDEAADAQFTGIFYAVRDYRRGALPSEVQDNPVLMRFIKETADQSSIITEATEFNDIQARMSENTRKKYWEEYSKAANFLKHADRDSGKSLDLDRVDNLDLLMRATRSYIDITGNTLGTESEILLIYAAVKNQFTYILEEDDQKIAELLNKMSPEKQLKACQLYIDKFTSDSATEESPHPKAP